jgi:hypothetical protein
VVGNEVVGSAVGFAVGLLLGSILDVGFIVGALEGLLEGLKIVGTSIQAIISEWYIETKYILDIT